MNLILKNILFLCFTLLVSINITPQNAVLDSLENELLLHAKKDTVRVNLLNSIAFKYINNDVDLARTKAVEANKLASSINFTRGEARSFVVLSNIYMSKNEYNKAIEDGTKALELFQEINNSYGISSTYNILGTISVHQNKLDKSLIYFKKGLIVAKEKKKEKLQSLLLNSLGNVSFSKGKLDEAQQYFKKSNVISEKLGYTRAVITASNNIAVISMIQGRYIEALEYFNKNLLIHRANNNKRGIATATLNIGGVYWERNQPKKALIYLKESLTISKELENKKSIAKCLVNIGEIYLDSKKYQKALDYYTEALSINTSINNIQGQFFCHKSIGGLYLIQELPEKALMHFKSSQSLAKQSQSKIFICYANISLSEVYFVKGKYLEALEYGLKGNKMADSLGLLLQQKEVNYTLSKIYEVTGDYQKSLNHFKLHKSLNDSLFNVKNVKKITQLEYEYKYKQRLESANNRELKLTKTVKSTSQNLEKSQRNYLMAIIIFLGVSIFLGTIIFYLRLRNVKSITENVIIEQKLLRSQMTPHFIFNSLSVLQGIILNKEEKKSILYLSKFSKLLRITLENSRNKMVSLQQELMAIENYLELQNLEVTDSYNYTILVDGIVDKAAFSIPPMLIQPFIENSIEHGFRNKKENRKIDIHIKYLNNNLTCTITDNGIGIDAQKERPNQHKKSLATAITSERLEMLSKNYKTKGSIRIEDRQKDNEQGTIVTLVIPYQIIRNG